MENRSFLVDTSNLKDVNDVLADDSGSWVNNGTDFIMNLMKMEFTEGLVEGHHLIQVF